MWNIGYFKPILEYLKANGVHPITCIYACINDMPEKYSNLKQVFDNFLNDTSSELFDSIEEIKEYYLNDKSKFEELSQDGFSKLNFKYTAKFLLDEEFTF